MFEKHLNQMVMIRTYSAGVHYGTLEKIESAEKGYDVLLKDARRVYNWAGACSLSQLSLEGSKKPNDSKISVTVPFILLRAIEVIAMTDKAVENLSGIMWRFDEEKGEVVNY